MLYGHSNATLTIVFVLVTSADNDQPTHPGLTKPERHLIDELFQTLIKVFCLISVNHFIVSGGLQLCKGVL